MEFTKQSLLKIKSLISTDKKLDFQTYYKIIEILRNDPLFNNPIKYVKSNSDSPAYTDPSTGILYFSDSLIPYSENFYKNYSYLPNYNDIDAFNYKFLFTLLHELTHLKQCDYAKNDNGVLGLLYKKVLFEGDIDEEHYINNPRDYVFEYNADIESMKILKMLFSDNDFLKALNYMEFIGLLLNYYYDDTTDSFLAEKTFKLLKITDENIKKVYDKPLNVLIHNGLPVNKNVLNELYENPVLNLIKVRKKYDL